MSKQGNQGVNSAGQNKAGGDQHTVRTGQGNGVLGQREGKGGNRAQKNPDSGKQNANKKS